MSKADCGLVKTSAFVDGLLTGAADFLFGLESVVEFGAGLVAAQDVQFVGASPDSFFE